MNRTFLIILMIASAMMIAVIGQREPENHLSDMPWEVVKLENNTLRTFGVTLGKTHIQEVNQIFSQFAETQLHIRQSKISNQAQYQLIAHYKNLNIAGLLANIDIVYQLNQEDLQQLYKSIPADVITKHKTHYPISQQAEINFLNTPVANIIYIPSINYDLSTIYQRFGQPSIEKEITDNEKFLSYPEIGLEIYIDTQRPDKFIYSALKSK